MALTVSMWALHDLVIPRNPGAVLNTRPNMSLVRAGKQGRALFEVPMYHPIAFPLHGRVYTRAYMHARSFPYDERSRAGVSCL